MVTGLGNQILNVLQNIYSTLAGKSASAGATGSAVGSGASGGGAGAGAVIAGLANPAAVASNALGKLSGTVDAVVGPFMDLVNLATRFVSAVDPYVVAELNRAFRDLSAVVGGTLRPILYAAADVVRNTIGSLGPVMASLTPIVEKIANVIGSVLILQVENFATLLEGLTPIIDFFSDIMVGIVQIMATWYRTLRPIIDVLIELGTQLLAFVANLLGVQGNAKDMFANLNKAFQELIKNVILAAATLMKMFGMDKTLSALIKGLQPQAKGPLGGQAVAQNSQFVQIADLGKSAYQSAFAASGMRGGPDKNKPEDFLKDILPAVLDIQKGLGGKLPEPAQQILEAMMAASAGIGKAVTWLEMVWRKLPDAPVFDGSRDTKADRALERAMGGTPQQQLGTPEQRQGNVKGQAPSKARV